MNGCGASTQKRWLYGQALGFLRHHSATAANAIPQPTGASRRTVISAHLRRCCDSPLADRREVGDQLALRAVLAEADHDNPARLDSGHDSFAERRMDYVLSQPVCDRRGVLA